jgi:hypothetical protein
MMWLPSKVGIPTPDARGEWVDKEIELTFLGMIILFHDVSYHTY